jgi:hypothetical protein
MRKEKWVWGGEIDTEMGIGKEKKKDEEETAVGSGPRGTRVDRWRRRITAVPSSEGSKSFSFLFPSCSVANIFWELDSWYRSYG